MQLLYIGNRRSSGPRNRGTFAQHVTLVRKMQLAMNIFNVTTSGTVFSFKLICLSSGIVGLYFFVRVAFVQPFLSTLVFFVLFFNAFTFYSVMWGNVNVIPNTMDQIRSRLVTSSAAADRKLAQRLTKSIPCVAVRVGNFMAMERNSVPIFLDFVVQQVASCLIGF